MFDIGNPVHWLIAVVAVASVVLLLRVFFSPQARERRRRERNHRRVVSKARRPMVSLAVKTQDEIETGRQKRSSIEGFHLAQEIGLLDQDLFILMREGTPPLQHRDQHHARKYHSYLWVFRKHDVRMLRKVQSSATPGK